MSASPIRKPGCSSGWSATYDRDQTASAAEKSPPAPSSRRTASYSSVVMVSGTTHKSGTIPPPPYTTRPPADEKRGFSVNSTGRSTRPPSKPTGPSRSSADRAGSFWIDRPAGVNHRAVVRRRTFPALSRKRV